MDAEQFASAMVALGVQLSPEQLAAFAEFEEKLYALNAVMNLTRVPREECWIRHFLDSLLFQDLIPAGARVLDLGTGPGFPAWPLACARPDLQVTALDSNRKMLAFLESVPLPNLTIVNARAEEWKSVKPFEFVTGRAVAPLAVQLEISARPCARGGRVVPMRTPTDEGSIPMANLEHLGLQFIEVVRRELPGSDATRLFPIYEKVANTHKGYPRRWADIKSRWN